MKLLKPFNLIMFVLIPIIMFFGFTLYSYAATGTVTISQTTGTAKAQFSGINGYYSIGGGTGYSDDMFTKITGVSLTVKSSATATFTRPLSVELHLVTTEGDFVLTGNKVASLSTSATSIMGTGAGTSFQGVPVAYYCVVDYQTSTNVTITIAGSFTWTTEHDNQNYWHTTINGHVVDTMNNTETIIQMLQDLGKSSFTETFELWKCPSTPTNIQDEQNYLYNVSYSLATWLLGLNETPEYAFVELYYITTQGLQPYGSHLYAQSDLKTSGSNVYIQASPSNFYNLGSSFYVNGYPLAFYAKVTIFGDSLNGFPVINQAFSGQNLRTGTINRKLKTSLNVYDTRESQDWSTISNSQELTDLNDKNDSIGTIISDNNNFETSAFTDFSSNLDEFGFDDWSLVPIAADLTTTKNIITMFYNILPFKVQWLFTSVMALGLIVMLLTVGTRVVQRTGDFTRAKPVKMKNPTSHKKG